MPSGTDIRHDRREAIRELLLAGPQPNQRALVEVLRRRGLVATQSSVSRDLKDLGAVKTADGYELPDAGGADDAVGEVAALLRTVDAAGPNLLVVRTAIGAAQRVAVALDRSGWPGIVGTVAGDDTIFVATASAADQRRISNRMKDARA